jgi:hypothetical protein
MTRPATPTTPPDPDLTPGRAGRAHAAADPRRPGRGPGAPASAGATRTATSSTTAWNWPGAGTRIPTRPRPRRCRGPPANGGPPPGRERAVICARLRDSDGGEVRVVTRRSPNARASVAWDGTAPASRGCRPNPLCAAEVGVAVRGDGHGLAGVDRGGSGGCECRYGGAHDTDDLVRTTRAAVGSKPPRRRPRFQGSRRAGALGSPRPSSRSLPTPCAAASSTSPHPPQPRV